MKKYIIALLPIVMLGACTKDLTSLNTNPKLYPTVPAKALFSQAERVLSNTVTTESVGVNIYRLIEQQWEETTYTDEANYNINGRSINAGQWNALYRDVLNNLKLFKTLAATDPAFTDAAVQKNAIAIADICQVYSFYYLVTTFGDIPYTQALDPSNAFPVYDDAATVYKDLLTRITADAAALDVSAEGLGSADLLYGGDVAAWKKFAYTFMLKMGMTISDYDAALSKSTVAAAVAGGVFTSNGDNAVFNYLSSPPNTNPVWVDLVQSGRKDYVAASTLINYLTTATGTGSGTAIDPRVAKFFTPDAASTVAKVTYSGGAPGASSNYDTFSKVNPTITAPTYPGLLLDYAETEFYLAEAAAKGYGVPGTVADHYKFAIQASFAYWGADDADKTLSAAIIKKYPYSDENLGYQKWVADYNRGWDAWIENRRLDYPALVAPKTALTPFPVRMNYPIAESNVNGANYKAASAAIGGDVVATKLFFDKGDIHTPPAK